MQRAGVYLELSNVCCGGGYNGTHSACAEFARRPQALNPRRRR